jgi:pyruvate dehydrogenase E1 component
MYRLSSVSGQGHGQGQAQSQARAQIFGSGPIVREALAAQELLAHRFGVASDVWSVTSYKELRRDALAVERWNRLHPDQPPRQSHVERVLAEVSGPFIAVSDYMRLVCEQIARWVPGPYTVLGTDGFGRSDTRAALRRHFEIDAAHIAYAALVALADDGEVPAEILADALRQLDIDPDAPDPATL